MNISVEYKDQSGNTRNRSLSLSRLAFVKHLAIAGQGYAPKLQKLLRTIAMFVHYSHYFNKQDFNNDRFSEPPPQLSDPTEKGQFSNLAGKAIADFLSKRINNSLFTVNYEAAMRMRLMPLNVRRPDLLAYTQNSLFAIEAKGYSGSSGNMTNHKAQAAAGGIPVNFTVACVSYNIYNNVKCNYYDPFIDNVPYDEEGLSELSRNYYKGLFEFCNSNYFEYQEFKYQDESFYEIELSPHIFELAFPQENPFFPICIFDIFEYYKPKLILPKRINEFVEKGISNEIKPFPFEAKDQGETIYIDNDRVGLKVESR